MNVEEIARQSAKVGAPTGSVAYGAQEFDFGLINEVVAIVDMPELAPVLAVLFILAGLAKFYWLIDE